MGKLKKNINKKQLAKLDKLFQQAILAQQNKHWQQAERVYQDVLGIDVAYLITSKPNQTGTFHSR